MVKRRVSRSNSPELISAGSTRTAPAAPPNGSDMRAVFQLISMACALVASTVAWLS